MGIHPGIILITVITHPGIIRIMPTTRITIMDMVIRTGRITMVVVMTAMAGVMNTMSVMTVLIVATVAVKMKMATKIPVIAVAGPIPVVPAYHRSGAMSRLHRPGIPATRVW